MGYYCGEIAKEKKELETVDEHNTRRRMEREEVQRQARLTGVACPKCGKELEWSSVAMLGMIFPPVCLSEALCKPCGLTINLEK